LASSLSPLREMGFYHTPLEKGGFIFPPLEKGGEGGLQKANKDRGDMKLPMIYKISPDPSLLKRGTKLVSGIFIIPLLKAGAYFPPPKGRWGKIRVFRRDSPEPP